MVDNIKSDILDRVNILTEDIEDIEYVEGKIEELEEQYREENIKEQKIFHRRINGLESNIRELKNDIVERDDKIQHQEQKAKEVSKTFCDVFIVRQQLLGLFSDMYRKNQNKLSLKSKVKVKELDYKYLARITSELENKNMVNDEQKIGVKYALAVINNECNGFSPELARYYLKLNNKAHPKTKPIIIVKESIQHLKFVKTKYPDYKPCDLDLTIDLLNEIEKFCS